MVLASRQALQDLKTSIGCFDDSEVQRYVTPSKQIPGLFTQITKKIIRFEEGRNSTITDVARTCLSSLYYSGIFTPYLKHVCWLSKKAHGYNTFKQMVQVSTPPKDEPTQDASQKQTSNHLYTLVIKDNLVWKKNHVHGSSWVPLYFDGYEEDRVPKIVDTCGANIIIIDDKDEVHYKKGIKEWRDKEGSYCYIDKTQRDNWKPQWYSFPVLHYMYNMFASKRLQLPEGYRAIAASHRGQYTSYYYDAKGVKQYDEVGTSTLFLLARSGRSIPIADPWLPFGFTDFLPFVPESSFVGDNIRAAASTLLIIGTKLTQPNIFSGEGSRRVITLYTRFADFDTTGHNPLKSYSYVKSKEKGVIHLPAEEWIEHPIALSGNARLSKRIDIQQTGEGNDKRMLIVYGTNSASQIGYYSKKISNSGPYAWTFTPKKVEILDDEWYDKDLGAHAHSANPPSSLRGSITIFKDQFDAKLQGFYQTVSQAKIVFSMNNQEYYLKLCNKPSSLSVTGYIAKHYTLILPKKFLHQSSHNSAHHQKLVQLFNKNRCLDVHIADNQDVVNIVNTGIASRLQFSFLKS